MSILEILFIVFIILWFISLLNNNLGRYAVLLPWICVVLLAWMTHTVHI